MLVLRLSETVFIDDAHRSIVDIYTPGMRLPFAGYPLVGVAWFLGLERLELPVGSIPVRRADGFTWISALPPRTLRQYASTQEMPTGGGGLLLIAPGCQRRRHESGACARSVSPGVWGAH
ncbi:hypothetical protein [Actinomadura sp. 21ATH]|uniref:hypothetical protein n=1 Tax=Actinomadura sp. 21ATH TaxID=1735444 RepID=UPI0035BFEB16